MTKSLSIETFELSGDILSIVFKERVEALEQVQDLILSFKKRELNTEEKFTVNIKRDNKGRGLISFDLTLVNFYIEKKNIIDIFVYVNNESVPMRLTKKIPNLKDRSNSYSSKAYFIDDKTVAVPYFTKKNELSLLVGSKGQVYRSFCTYLNSKIYLDHIESLQEGLKITASSINFHEAEDFYFVIKNRKNKKDSKIIGSKKVNAQTVVVNLLEREWKLKERYDLYLNVKTGKMVQIFRIFINENSYKTNTYPLIDFDETLKIQPYITTKGEVSFLVLNNWLYEYEISNKKIHNITAQNLAATGEMLRIELGDENSSILEEHDQLALIIKRTKNSDSIIVDSNSYEIHKEYMLINMKSIIEQNDFNEEEKWNFYIKGYNYPENTVRIYRLQKQNVFAGSNSLAFLPPLKLSEDKNVIIYISPKKAIGMLVGDRYLYQRLTYQTIDSTVAIEELSVKPHKIDFKLQDIEMKKVEYVNIILEARKSKEKWTKEIDIQEMNGKETISLDLQEFCDMYQYSKSRWDFKIEVFYENFIMKGKIGCFNQELKPKHFRYLEPIYTLGNTAIVPYLTIYNELAFVINDLSAIANERITADVSLTNFSMKKSFLNGKVKVDVPEADDYTIDSMMLKYRGKADDIIEYIVPVNSKKIKGTTVEIAFDLDVSNYEFQSFYWDMYLLIEIQGNTYPVKIKNPTAEVKKEIDTKITEYSYSYDNGYFIYPYISQGNTLALTYREKPAYESNIYKLKEKAAYLTYRLFKGYFDKKDIWLAYEKFSEGAQDNGYYFFKYCYEKGKKKDFYYIIKKDSPDYENVAGMKDKVVDFMSFKYMLLMYAAKALISSESKGHAYDIRIQKGKIKEALDKKKHVFLQHGVTALKRVDYVFKKTKNNAVDLFVATSDYEKDIIKKYFGYNENEIITTGFCRWDVLEDKSGEQKEIFVMPTWRTWMDDLPEEQFLESDYYKNYVGFFKSERLKNILSENNVNLSFYIHPKFKTYIDNFNVDNKHIKIYQYGEEKVNELLMKSSMLVTDYSSVAWEMFYQKKPVVFFQFDVDKYNAFQGSYLDMETELFGDRVFDVKQLVDSVEEYIKQDFREKQEYGNMRSKYFKYVDKKNSERTYKAIKAGLKKNPAKK